MSYRYKVFAALFTGLMMISFVLKAQDKQQVRTYVAERVVGKAPVIDGKLNDKAWSEGNWAGDFRQYDPYNGKKPSQKTEFKILYDNNNLYVAIRCFDTEPNKIVQRLTRRDNIDGDWAGVSIDSYFDKRTAFGFIVSAAGVKLDGKFSDDNGNIDNTWNPVWYVKTSKDSEGWVAEMRIPLSQLRFAKKSDMTWGLEVVRNIFRKQEKDFWQPIAKDASGFESHYGLLTGLKNIKPKKEVTITPYIMSKLMTAPRIEGDPFATGRTGAFSAGLDGTIAVTNDLTLNFTINPDFGEVDADPSQVNLTAFETYFTELRPFFVEGSSIFNFPLIAGNDNSEENLFYSRRIGRPPQYYPDLADSGEYIKSPGVTKILGAFKLSGKTRNGWSIGAMEALTGKVTASLDSLGKRSKVAVEPMTNYFNARLQKDFKNGNTILGGMFTATDRFIHDSSLFFLPSGAYTGGIDFRNYWKDHAYRLSAKIIASSVVGGTQAITDLQENSRRYFQRPGASRKVDSTARLLQGTSASVDFSKIAKGHWRYGVQAYMESPGLELNDQGYLKSTDVIQESSWLEYDIWEPFSIFRSVGMNMSEWSGWNFSGVHTSSGQNLSSWGQFKNYWYGEFGITHNGANLDWSELRGGPAVQKPGYWNYYLGFSTDSRKKVFLSLSFNDNVYYQNVGNSTSLSFRIHYQPLGFLNLSLTPALSQSRDGLIYVTDQEVNNQNVYIVSSINQKQISADLRVSLSFTPDLSLEYWGQPFLFSAKFYGYKRVQNPNQKNFESQFYKYTGNQIQYDSENNQYLINDPAYPGSTMTVDNPDFSVVEFRSNMVLRWEFVPGSTLYLVWSQNNSDSNTIGNFNFKNNWTTLVNTKPTNIFLVKFSYRIKI
ncbi:MAG: carbohydrate binding family 9 domain-containing protein [Bacteroidales bacterium]|nr:carbohydrate binding family 9 domain-containing protein [Bacteroidales bacterium]